MVSAASHMMIFGSQWGNHSPKTQLMLPAGYVARVRGPGGLGTELLGMIMCFISKFVMTNRLHRILLSYQFIGAYFSPNPLRFHTLVIYR
jgi:hypothetical protein